MNKTSDCSELHYDHEPVTKNVLLKMVKYLKEPGCNALQTLYPATIWLTLGFFEESTGFGPSGLFGVSVTKQTCWSVCSQCCLRKLSDSLAFNGM